MRISDWSSDVCSSDLSARSGRIATTRGSKTCELPVRPNRPRPAPAAPGRPMRTRLAAKFSPLSAVTCRPVATRGPPGADNRGPIDQQGRLYQECSAFDAPVVARLKHRSEEHTSELQSLMRTSYAVFCLKKKTKTRQ